MVAIREELEGIPGAFMYSIQCGVRWIAKVGWGGVAVTSYNT